MVADAAMLLDIPWSTAATTPSPCVRRAGTAGLLNAAVRGEGRFQLGVMTTSPWDGAYATSRSRPSIRRPGPRPVGARRVGHGIEFALEPDDSTPPDFRTIWQASASASPQGEQLDLLEPLTKWLVLRGRQVTARALAARSVRSRNSSAQ
jgi:amidase